MLTFSGLKLGLGAGLFETGQDGSRAVLQERLQWVLRVTTALCFIGHGSWGVMTKAGWVPFFTCMGIPEAWAWRLMPVIGTLDISLAALLLFRPRRILLVWMSLWCVWTALLRPLSGATMWEVWERGGNYGAPILFLILAGAFAMRPNDWLRKLELTELPEERIHTLEVLLRVFLALLLFGHAGFGVFVRKEMFLQQYASIGLPASKSLIFDVGCFEMFLAAGVLARPRGAAWGSLLWFVLIWKLFTEFLYVTSGPWANIFEWIERWGDYGLPIALLYIHRYELARKIGSGAARLQHAGTEFA